VLIMGMQYQFFLGTQARKPWLVYWVGRILTLGPCTKATHTHVLLCIIGVGKGDKAVWPWDIWSIKADCNISWELGLCQFSNYRGTLSTHIHTYSQRCYTRAISLNWPFLWQFSGLSYRNVESDHQLVNEMNALLNRRCKVCIYTEVCMEGNCKNTDCGLP
jgi:hypothetical protein